MMSMAPSPSSEIEPMMATDSVVMSGRTSFDTSSQTSTVVPLKVTCDTAPEVMPATRTGDPLLTVATLGNAALSG